ncbi:MAG: hypothetical protein SFV54_13190 [Bryobacteraceae bacterium]|nr:hypothetical protein [Bryobacteraceae bacterium]
MPRTYSGKIFDRPAGSWNSAANPPDSFAKAEADLASWPAGSRIDLIAVGANIEHDWRVPRARLSALWSNYPPPIGLDGLDLRIELLMSRFPREAILQPDNECNWALTVHRDTELFNAFRLRKELDFRIAALNDAGLPAAGATDAAVTERLKNIFPDGQPSDSGLNDSQERFVSALFERLEVSKYPVWVAPFDQMRSRLASGVDSWLAAVGVVVDGETKPPGEPVEPQLFFGLRYKKGDLTLVRPTLLEVYRYPQHFPCPPASCAAAGLRSPGGHPIGLTVNEAEEPLIDEFVHVDIRRTADMVVGWGWATGNGFFRRSEARRKHHARLCRQYADVPAWMREPT